MKAGEASKRVNIHPNTVREWATQYARFMSDGATARRRDFSERDLQVLATIQRLRDQGKPHFEIVAALDAGQLVDSVPPLTPPEVEEARKEVGLVPQVEVERSLAVERIQTLETALSQAIEERNEAIERWQNDTTDLNQRIAVLERELGEARGKLTAIEAERLPVRTMLQIAAVLLVGLLVFLALAVVFLAGRGG